MRYFYDTEYIDDGRTIDLISIGIVSDDEREYYAVSSEFDVGKLHSNKFLTDHVWPHLPLRPHPPGMRCRCIPGHLDLDHPDVKPRAQIAVEVKHFLLSGPTIPVLWAWFAAYDHVALSQLYGPMVDLPRPLPMYTNDLKQECDRLGNPTLPDQATGEHNALADARHNLVRARALDIYRAGGWGVPVGSRTQS